MDLSSGVYLPIVTPFQDGAVDYGSFARLLEHYRGSGIRGLIPLATTGESPTLEEDEEERLLEQCLAAAGGDHGVIAGVSGNSTRKVVKKLKKLEAYPLAGVLVTGPYYNLPSQEGIYEHFKAVAESTPHRVLIYNIPYRTGRNIENATIRRLAEIKNIRGIKDSCGDVRQSLALLGTELKDFHVFTGEDHFFFANLTHGGAGGILASAHLQTEAFVSVPRLLEQNNWLEAERVWRPLLKRLPLLFQEPNPAPVKYLLYRLGLIRSPETRLPLTGISEGLKRELDAWYEVLRGG